MSVLLELNVPPSELTVGRVLEEVDVELELEEIVPLGEHVRPYLWVSGEELEAFERLVMDVSTVHDFRRLTEFESQRFYKFEWDTDEETLIEITLTNDGVIKVARCEDDWFVRIMFPDNVSLSAFYHSCLENSVSITTSRVYPLSKFELEGYLSDATPEQQEALELAFERGYFDTPKEVTLTELAEELEISQQALSERVRKGNKKILEAVLGESVTFDELEDT